MAGQVDAVNHPPHYTSHPSGIECVQITEHMGFLIGNAVKYLFRAGKKGPIGEDLRKAGWYLEREIARRAAEAWRTFPEDPRYEISSAGNVRRIDTGRIRSLVPIRGGYLTFSTNVDGKAVTHYVHRAVARTFLGVIPDDLHVCHNDGNRRNNHLTNLRIDSVRMNARDRRSHGTHYYGGQNPAARLDESEVQEIRARTEGAETALAAEFGVSRATIGRVRRGESWADPRLDQERAFEAWLAHEPEGNVRDAVELIWRADLKGAAVEDLRKAVWYVEREIARREAGTER